MSHWVDTRTVKPAGREPLLAMDVHELSVDLAPGVRDLEFVTALNRYLRALQADGRIEHWRLLRSKLGLGVPRVVVAVGPDCGARILTGGSP
jgi:hypothetical protein